MRLNAFGWIGRCPEVKLAETTLASIRVRRRHHPGRPRQKPQRVIADRGYDSDGLRKQLRGRGIELIVPHRKSRRKPPMQDRRVLRRYKRRWIIERTIAWLGNYRRLTVRYNRSPTIYRWIFPYRLHPDRLTERFEIASKKKQGTVNYFPSYSRLGEPSIVVCDLMDAAQQIRATRQLARI